MNLETLVERACLESGYNDTDDVTAGKKFARHWDEHIWNAALWKAALVACDVSIDPTTNEDHVEGIVFLPEVIDRVVAVRCAANQIAVTGQEHYYRMDYDSFTAAGAPVEFNILPPGWLTLRSEWYVTVDAADDEIKMRLRYRYFGGLSNNIVTTLNAVAAQLNGDPDGGYQLIERFEKPVTTGLVRLRNTADDSILGTLDTQDTTAPAYQRLRLFPIPSAAITLKVLGKAKYEPLEFDQQEPALRNCTNALLAFIRGSLKRRGGEIGAAQLEFQEGNALLQQVMQIEALQAANNQRFMPAEGYGPEHGLGPIGIV